MIKIEDKEIIENNLLEKAEEERKSAVKPEQIAKFRAPRKLIKNMADDCGEYKGIVGADLRKISDTAKLIILGIYIEMQIQSDINDKFPTIDLDGHGYKRITLSVKRLMEIAGACHYSGKSTDKWYSAITEEILHIKFIEKRKKDIVSVPYYQLESTVLDSKKADINSKSIYEYSKAFNLLVCDRLLDMGKGRGNGFINLPGDICKTINSIGSPYLVSYVLRVFLEKEKYINLQLKPQPYNLFNFLSGFIDIKAIKNDGKRYFKYNYTNLKSLVEKNFINDFKIILATNEIITKDTTEREYNNIISKRISFKDVSFEIIYNENECN